MFHEIENMWDFGIFTIISPLTEKYYKDYLVHVPLKDVEKTIYYTFYEEVNYGVLQKKSANAIDSI